MNKIYFLLLLLVAPRGRKGTEGQSKEGGVGWGTTEREGVFVCEGQKGGRAWKIPEQSGWYGGGGRSACVITREDSGLVSLQAASSRCGSNRASSDLVFVLCLYYVCIVQ